MGGWKRREDKVGVGSGSDFTSAQKVFGSKCLVLTWLPVSPQAGHHPWRRKGGSDLLPPVRQHVLDLADSLVKTSLSGHRLPSAGGAPWSGKSRRHNTQRVTLDTFIGILAQGWPLQTPNGTTAVSTLCLGPTCPQVHGPHAAQLSFSKPSCTPPVCPLPVEFN